MYVLLYVRKSIVADHQLAMLILADEGDRAGHETAVFVEHRVFDRRESRVFCDSIGPAQKAGYGDAGLRRLGLGRGIGAQHAVLKDEVIGFDRELLVYPLGKGVEPMGDDAAVLLELDDGAPDSYSL